jgi:hypothetical protein
LQLLQPQQLAHLAHWLTLLLTLLLCWRAGTT